MCRKVFITLGILCFFAAARAKADDFAYAYCPLGEGYVFLYDSAAGFQVVANLKCGARLTVLDARSSDRAMVRTADGKEGYVLKSSITAVSSSGQPSPAASPNTASQQSQQPQPKPQAQAQPPVQPPTPPQPKAEAKPKRQPKAQPEPQLESQAQPQSPVLPQRQPEAQPQPQAPPEAPQQTELKPQTPTQPEAPIMPEPQVQPESQPQPQAPQQQAEPEPVLQAEVHSKPSPQLLPAPPQQPEPAATAFTPFSPLGYGQNVPRLEAYFGYSFLNAGTSGLASRQNVSGLEGSVAIHVNRWIAGEANIGFYDKSLQIISVGTFAFHDYVMMGGPRVNFHKAFFHALVGMDHLAGSANFYSVNGTGTDNSLAGAVGGGVQWNVTRQFALRTAADYLLSRFDGLTQNNIRVTVGLVFEMGSVNSRGE